MRRLRSVKGFNWLAFAATVEHAIETDDRVDLSVRDQMKGIMRFLDERVDPEMFVRIARKASIEYYLSDDDSGHSVLFWRELDPLLKNNKAGRSKKTKLMKLLESSVIASRELYTIFYIVLVNLCYVEHYSERELSMINCMCKIYEVFSKDFLEAFLDVYTVVVIKESLDILMNYYKMKISGAQLSAFECYVAGYNNYAFSSGESELIDVAKMNLVYANKMDPFPGLVIMDENVFRCCKEEVWDVYDAQET